MVNNARLAIQLLFPHICQCAITCTWSGKQRYYSLLLSPACLYSWIHGIAHAMPIHLAACSPKRLAQRLRKYNSRGLDVDLAEIQDLETNGAENKFSNRIVKSFCHMQHTCHSCGWQITVKNSLLSEVTFKPCQDGEFCKNRTQASLPVVFYACGNIKSYKQLAYASDEIPWLLRGLASRYAFHVTFPTLPPVCSTQVMPQ